MCLPKRHSDNPSLHLYHDPFYKQFPVMQGHGPYVEEYLQTLYKTLRKADQQYPRLMALRIDLVPPKGLLERMSEADERKLIGRFIESLKAQIEADRQRVKRASKRAAGCTLRYVWCREFSESQVSRGPHFHFLFLFNKDAYFKAGPVGGEWESLVNRISKAWSRALRIEWDPDSSLVYICDNGCYLVRSREDVGAISAIFTRASYLCKAETKIYGTHRHAFGASRV